MDRIFPETGRDGEETGLAGTDMPKDGSGSPARERIPIIEVKNLYKIYRVGETKVYALGGVDFTMYKGEFCAIVGPSGSGKSTLLNMLAGLEKPTKGEVIVSGQHMETLNEDGLVKFRRDRKSVV